MKATSIRALQSGLRRAELDCDNFEASQAVVDTLRRSGRKLRAEEAAAIQELEERLAENSDKRSAKG